MIMGDKLDKYANYFNDSKLFSKIINFSGKAGKNLLFYSLILYFMVSDKDIPIRTRIVFLAALGYFILPTDLISDFLPGLGFTDDLSFITYAITQGTDHITPEIKSKAKEKLNGLLKIDPEEFPQEDEELISE